jgi:hypothetical protein
MGGYEHSARRRGGRGRMREIDRWRDRGERVRSTMDKVPLHMHRAHPPMLYPFFKALPDQDQLKGTVSRDFLLLVFFMIQFPPSPRVFH